MGSTALILAAVTGAIVGLPLIGVMAGGLPLTPYLQFPPLTRHVLHAPFSWPVYWTYSAVDGVVVAILIAAARRSDNAPQSAGSSGATSYPGWGWGGLVFAGVSWILAWNRYPWFAGLQPHTFILLWLSFILVLNGLCQRQSGSCPMLRRPLLFLLLFPLSSLFWWYFEYLNRFVQNWWYTGVSYGPLQYTLYASMSFSTVLPAVVTAREWIAGHEGFRRRFHGLSPLSWRYPRIAATGMILAAAGGLTMIGRFPDSLFPLLWISPLLILSGVRILLGKRHGFSEMVAGDWRPAVSAALAGLFCGIFWEMWNQYSLAKWVYTIPYVQRFHLFEMPILGYMGYLPFGLECIAVFDLIEEAWMERFG
jgi:hypothetical protein